MFKMLTSPGFSSLFCGRRTQTHRRERIKNERAKRCTKTHRLGYERGATILDRDYSVSASRHLLRRKIPKQNQGYGNVIITRSICTFSVTGPLHLFGQSWVEKKVRYTNVTEECRFDKEDQTEFHLHSKGEGWRWMGRSFSFSKVTCTNNFRDFDFLP